jgi:tetratricopeptide (TPR) repeat protein
LPFEDFKVVWYKAYGLADRETRQPAVATTLFQAGSVSKPVAALAANPEEESLSESYLNNLGLNTLTEASVYAADLLRINTDLYPDSANTWDSLAFAYRQTGDPEKAVHYYREALKRDPEFASAKRGLAELGAEQ